MINNWLSKDYTTCIYYRDASLLLLYYDSVENTQSTLHVFELSHPGRRGPIDGPNLLPPCLNGSIIIPP